MKLFARVKLVTCCPSIPLRPAFTMAIRVKDGLVVLVSEMPLVVEFWIAPPVQDPAELQEPPLPLTMSAPFDPVVLRTIPFAAPFDEILRNSRLFEPIIVFATLSAMPVVVVRVLTSTPVAAGLHGFSSQTLT